MSNHIASQQTVSRHKIRGYPVEVERTTWDNDPGLSFDLYEKTGDGWSLVNNESWDDPPTRDQMLEALSERHTDLLCEYPSCSLVWRVTVEQRRLCREHGREFRAFLKGNGA